MHTVGNRFTWEICADGSKTIFDANFNQTFKSTHAACTEANEVFLKPGVLEHPRWPAPNFAILELGFGIGTNFRCIWDHLKNHTVSFTSIENDTAGCSVYVELESHTPTETLLRDKKFHSNHFHANLIIDNFYTSLTKLESHSFDCIFFDPFSPKTNPDAWDLRIFQECERILRPSGRLVTYSVSRIAKDHASSAGLQVLKRTLPEILRKRSSLLAIK